MHVLTQVPVRSPWSAHRGFAMPLEARHLISSVSSRRDFWRPIRTRSKEARKSEKEGLRKRNKNTANTHRDITRAMYLHTHLPIIYIWIMASLLLTNEFPRNSPPTDTTSSSISPNTCAASLSCDTTSRPAGHASRRRAHWRNEQGAINTQKKKSTKKHER